MKRIIVLSILIAGTLFSCKSEKKESSSSEETQKEITIGLVDGWAEGVAMTHIAQEILSREGYDVEIEKAAVDLIFASLNNGDTDVFMDTWLPATHGDKVKKFNNLVQLGKNYDQARIGLVVPSYVTINSIEELNANIDQFDGKIIGIEKGAGITKATDNAIKDYGLKLEQLNSSSVAMLSELQKAIKENRWVVVAGWAPHWKFGRFDLKFLEDPKKVYGEAEMIETYARKGFKEDDAFAANFFTNVHFDEATMADLLSKMEEGGDNKEQVAKQWVDNHKELVEAWLSKK